MNFWRWTPCSGQSRGPRHWALRLENGAPWVRAMDSRGHVRLFASYTSAAFSANQLNSEPGFRPWRPAP